LPDSYAPLVLVVMNVVYALSAYPLGRLADRVSHMALLSAGLITLIIADLVLAQAQGLSAVALGVALWGLHLGMTQGLLATMVADTAPAHLRGTAGVTFYAGAIFSTAALLMLALRNRRSPAA